MMAAAAEMTAAAVEMIVTAEMTATAKMDIIITMEMDAAAAKQYIEKFILRTV